MTNPNHTHITAVVDRTGSMRPIKADAEGAINTFLADQGKVPGTGTLLFVDFDSDQPHRIWHDGDLGNVETYVMTPRAMTPLYDAIGWSIAKTGERLDALAEEDRPGHVFFVIVTDGEENASREFTRQQVTDMIKEHEDRYAWTFVFLAAGPAAWSAARDFVGTRMVGANTVTAASGGDAYYATMDHLNTTVAATRSGARPKGSAFAATVTEDGTVTEADPT